MRPTLLLAIGMTLISMDTECYAGPSVEFKFVGSVIEVIDSTNNLQPLFPVGQTVTGSYVFDASAPDLQPSAQIGEYLAISSLNVSFGDALSLELGDGVRTISVINLNTAENYSLIADIIGPAIGGFEPRRIALNLTDRVPPTDELDSDDIPLAPPPLDSFEQTNNLFFVTNQTSSDPRVQFGLQSLTVVPECSGALYVGLCMLACGAIRKYATAKKAKAAIFERDDCSKCI